MLRSLQWVAETCSSAKTVLCAVVGSKCSVFILMMRKIGDSVSCV